jgi:hypothetical protein
MALYTIRKPGGAITPDTGTVTYMSMIAAATRSIRIQEFSHSGLGTASAANELRMAPAPTGTTPGGAVTPTPFNPLATVAAGFTTATTYATAPAINAQAGISYGCNSNGGTYRWLAKTNFELIASAAVASFATMAWAVVSGTGSLTGHVLIEEI